MAVVFLEKGLSPIPMQMANVKCYRGPPRWVCQFAHCRMRNSQIIKRNLLLNLDFLYRVRSFS
jgi:hypothetical protein